ncbi:tyrosine-type recombinase/integrase [Nitrospira sp. Nam74]
MKALVTGATGFIAAGVVRALAAAGDISKVRSLTTYECFYTREHRSNEYSELSEQRTGIGILHLRVHDLRHCAATNLRRAGVDTATAIKIVGHKSEKMWKRYTAIEEKDLTNAAWELNTYFQLNTLITPAGYTVPPASVSA